MADNQESEKKSQVAKNQPESFEEELRVQFMEGEDVGKPKTPCKGTVGAAGYDLYAAKDMTIPARGKALVSTGLVFEIPLGTYGRIAPRSSLAWKHFIDVGAGVIDSDYRGEVKVLLFNHSDQDFEVKVGDRCAQMIIEKIALTKLKKVTKADETARGEGGFGSTGRN